jgi:hypothetical protein
MIRRTLERNCKSLVEILGFRSLRAGMGPVATARRNRYKYLLSQQKMAGKPIKQFTYMAHSERPRMLIEEAAWARHHHAATIASSLARAHAAQSRRTGGLRPTGRMSTGAP